MPRAQRGGDIPADSHENDVWGEMRTFEADRHRRSPSCVILGYRGRSYPKSTQMKICDRTIESAQAMLDMRSTYLNGDWDDFTRYRIEQETQRLYPHRE